MLIKVKVLYKRELKPVPLYGEVSEYHHAHPDVSQHLAPAGPADIMASEFLRESVF